MTPTAGQSGRGPATVARYPWGGVHVPASHLGQHYALMGMTGSGKTLSLRMLMKGVLVDADRNLLHRAVVYDPKREFVPLLVGMGVPYERIHILHPFDKRCRPWDIASDIRQPSHALQLATVLAPPDDESTQPFFSRAAIDVLATGIEILHDRFTAQWTLNDLVSTMTSPSALRQLLSITAEGRSVHELYVANTETFANVMTSLRTKLAPYKCAARLWARIPRSRYMSLADWAKDADEPSVLVLGTENDNREALEPINRAIFRRLAQLATSSVEHTSGEPETWFFIDEARLAGKLDGLHELLLEGRSHGAHVVLGFQDIQGLKHIYGTEQAEELIGQCANLAILKLNNPTSMEWAERFYGEYETLITTFNSSQTSGHQSSSSTQGEGQQFTQRKSVLAAQFRCFPLPDSRGCVAGAFACPSRAWIDVATPEFMATYLTRPAEAGAGELEAHLGFVGRDPSEQNPFEDAEFTARLAAASGTNSEASAWKPLADLNVADVELCADGGYVIGGIKRDVRSKGQDHGGPSESGTLLWKPSGDSNRLVLITREFDVLTLWFTKDLWWRHTGAAGSMGH